MPQLLELTDVQKDLLQSLHTHLATWSIPRTNPPRTSVGAGRSCTFGRIKKRYGGREWKDGVWNTKKPKIWELLQAYGATVPVPWTSIQINQNCVCAKHKDKNNVGDSYLVSLGDYTGGELVVEGTPYDTSKNGIVFNGSELEHWNNEIVSGNKWSIVFFPAPIKEQLTLPHASAIAYWSPPQPQTADQ